MRPLWTSFQYRFKAKGVTTGGRLCSNEQAAILLAAWFTTLAVNLQGVPDGKVKFAYLVELNTFGSPDHDTRRHNFFAEVHRIACQMGRVGCHLPALSGRSRLSVRPAHRRSTGPQGGAPHDVCDLGSQESKGSVSEHAPRNRRMRVPSYSTSTTC